ncbi:FUSC family protein [Mycolicibacterium smegmatis]|uniref:FUSC family protein n=1 Tax=Mycolicibacterium smegmatis TaxID=1772 RepID=UPI0005D9413D|nr:FUSC family protein [Mycolicibacterium smegmatis]MDF1901649.1 FUSC family protein [Mycolicibacterium smegmatis]MDF1907993.1 FUSC family protein [Mycolicibacterium smegmatis]MDF1920505.1 FUSC family protein [Mycolicibacterium smegmatis]MDF1926521.1 FUSC family protein [Mycolicibacterium smegmatis]UAK58245.1 FUSC family protein [Mycolicibacterium smegmatis]
MTRRLPHGYVALAHAVTPKGWRGVLRGDFRKAGLAVPLRVGVAVTLVFVAGGVFGHRDVAGFAALGALVSAFCRPDPYPVRAGRLAVLGIGITAAIGIGAVLGATGSGVVVSTLVISLLAGAAAYLMWALHIVGPGAVVFVFGAVGGQAFAHDAGDVVRAVTVTAAGAVLGAVAALAPWLLQKLRRADGTTQPETARREPLRVTLTRAPHRALLARSARITVAGAVAAAAAMGLGLDHPMWAAMGAVAAMQGVGYHVTVHRGVQRLLGNVGGGVLAAGLLALPLGYWGAVVAIIVFQVAAEVASTVNYALTSLAVTPMALLLTGLGSGLAPGAAVDRVFDTAVGIVVGIGVAAITISGAEVEHLRRGAAAV